MVATIDQALIIEFSDKVHLEAQQMQSRLKPYVEIKQMTGDVFAYDGLGRVDAREVAERNAVASFDTIAHNRRKMIRKRFVINLPIDDSDVRGALQDPQSGYAKAIAAGAVRQYDRVIQAAAFADVLTGRDFETTVTAATDGVVTVDATAGLTYDKILEIHQNFIDADVGTDQDEKLFLTITGDEHTSCMNELELINSQYNRAYAVESGRIKNAAGIDLVLFAAGVSNPIIPTSGGQRQLIAGSSRGICLGISKEMSLKVEERPDLIETTQIQVVFEIGAVRTEGSLIQKVSVTA
jgi:hypothetical protein